LIETLDHLAGDWKIYQLKGGHRFSADDLLTAWTAARFCPHADRLLDLGCGLGSVGLLTLWRLPLAHLTGVEIQETSYHLAEKTVAYNRLGHRVRLLHQDLRQPLEVGLFPLVTGSPPYFPPHKSTLSPHPQRAAARCELNGDIYDYCQSAARHLAPEGRFVFIHAAADPRPEEAVQQAGLKVIACQQVYFRSYLPPTVALYICAWKGPRQDLDAFVIRDERGRWTEEYLAMRREMGTPNLRNRDPESPQ